MKNIRSIIAILAITIFVASAYGQQDDPSSAETLPPVTPEVSAPAQIAAKPEGTIRIGIVATRAQLGQEVAAAEASQAVVQLWIGYLNGPSVEAVVIEARSPTNVNIEARQKECDFVLYSGLLKKTKTSLFGSLLKVAAPALTSQISAVGNSAGASSARRSITESGKDAAKGALASKITGKDEITLNFDLVATGEASVVKSSVSAKAKTDGEDVISLLIEQASEKILQTAIKK